MSPITFTARAATYNIGASQAGAFSSSTKFSEAFFAKTRSDLMALCSSADVVVLQEVSSEWAAKLPSMLPDWYDDGWGEESLCVVV